MSLLFRDLLSAGASDYLVKPSTREALTAVLERTSASFGTTPDGLGQVIVFIGSRGGVGATTSAVSCAWLMANERRERVALVDLDLHFGTVALKLDLDPGSGSVRGPGAAVAHRQPVHRARDDQGQR